MADYGEPISYLIAEELEQLKQRIIMNMQTAGQVASGKTIASLFVERRANGGSLVFRGKMPFGVMETGRKGGKVPYGFSSIIYLWMQQKGVHGQPMPYKRKGLHKYSEQERADRSMASAIAHTIARSGTKLYRDGGRKDIYSNEIPTTIASIRERLLPLMREQIRNIKLNTTGEAIK